MARLKICGLKRLEDIEYVNEIGTDYAGFILSEGFGRSIDFETAKALKKALSPSIKAVGVFVNDSRENIEKYLKGGIIDIVQLHGDESADFCSEIEAPVIKYFPPEKFELISKYDTDYLLFDSGTGTGQTFDWSKIPKTDKPFFLAGGLNKYNIPEAIKELSPFCIDLSSAVETNGNKDYNKIKEIKECMENE